MNHSISTTRHLDEENFESFDDKKGSFYSLVEPGSMTRENDDPFSRREKKIRENPRTFFLSPFF
jgi:hypothetical protein